MSSTGASLRPRSLGEILDRTAQLYRGNFLLFAGISVLPMAVLFLAFVPIGALVGYFGVAGRTTVASSPAVIGLLILGLLLLVVPILVLASVCAQAGLSVAAIKTHMGQKLSVRSALKEVQPNFWRYVWLLILQGIVVGLVPVLIVSVVIGVLAFLLSRGGISTAASVAFGFLIFLLFSACAVVIVVLALRYSLGMAVCVAENRGAWESLKRSVALTKGTRGRIFLMFLLVWALSVVISMIAYIPSVLLLAIVTAMGHGAQYTAFAMAAVQILNFLVNFSMQALITPVYVTALVLFYYDQRVRNEGYDIEWMMEQAGLTGLSASSGAGFLTTSSESIAGPDSVKEP